MADWMQQTPLENPILGLLADRLKKAQEFAAKPFGYENPPVEMLMNLLGVPAVQQTMERMAYGEPLTTGSGMTTKPRAEAIDAALAVAPFAAPMLKTAQKIGPMVGEELAATMLGQRPNSLMSKIVPQPLFAVAPEQGLLATKTEPIESLLQVKPQAPVSDIGFYSATEQAALNLGRNKGTGQSFINDLMKAPDVKKEELAYTGLDDFLRDKPNVTKQEVQDFIAANKVDVQERQLGATITEDPIGIAKRKEVFDKYEPQIQAMYKEMDNPRYRLVNRGMGAEEYNRGVVLQNRGFRGEPLTVQEQSELDDILRRLDGNTVKEFANAEEARKVYLGMNQEEKLMHSIRPVKSPTELQQELNTIQRTRDIEANNAYVVPEPIPTKYQKYQLPGGENYREILLTLPQKKNEFPDFEQWITNRYGGSQVPEGVRQAARKEYERQSSGLEISGGYQSSHFNEPNILAHMRVNDRIDAEGKKMLLIEEVQSDWHQAGREKGYKTGNERAPAQVERELTATTQKRSRLLEEAAALPDSEMTKFKAMNEEIKKLSDQATKLNEEWTNLLNKPEGVPDAPFKDTWYQLALKRLTKYAADNGYERIGLTTGRQQASRFDLSKQVDEIAVPTVNSDGSRSVRIDPTDGTSIKLMVDDKGVVTGYGAGSTQFSGKKLSEVIGKDIADKVMKADADTKFAGLDLSVGGEGMKKYYDEIYPKFLDKYGKKYGASVGETQITTDYARDANGIPAQRPSKETIRYLDITPQMKEGTSKGQPLFAATPLLPATSLLDEEKRKEITSLLE